MLNWILKRLIGPDLAPLLQRNAQIVDVRTPNEFAQGHAHKSINIPLQQIKQSAKKLKKDRPVITCCRSGNRSGVAARQLSAMGFEVANGGPWQKVQKAIDHAE